MSTPIPHVAAATTKSLATKGGLRLNFALLIGNEACGWTAQPEHFCSNLPGRAQTANHPLSFIEYPGMFHVWMAAPIPGAQQALGDVARLKTGSG